MADFDPNLHFFGRLVEAHMRLSELRTFADRLDTFIAEQAVRCSSPSSDTEDDLRSMFEYPLPQLLHVSMTVASVIFLEATLRDFADGLRQALGLRLSLGDLNGSVLARFQRYATAVAGLALPIPQSQWQELREIVEIRNCLIHGDGDLRDFQRAAQVRAFSSRHGVPEIEENHIVMSRESSLLILDILRSTLEALYEHALDKFPGHYGSRAQR
jgi:hypothetical protein